MDRILSWLDLPAARRPHFLTLYFDRVDHAGHEHGPDSPEVDAAVRRIDAALARLADGLRRRGLYDRINMLVVSDHGMAPSPPEQAIPVDELVDPDRVQIVSTGVLAGFNPLSGYEAEAETALLKPHEHMHCWRKSAIPARLNYGGNPRVPAIACSPQTGWRIDTRDRLTRAGRRPPLGMHGYDNADPLMRALFVARGPAFRRGLVVQEFPNVNVYPLLTHLLGIPAQPNDGDRDAVLGMLRASAQ